MKTPARIALLLLAGLSMSGCATTSAMKQPTPATVAVLDEQPPSAQQHWLMRDIEDRLEARFASR